MTGDRRMAQLVRRRTVHVERAAQAPDPGGRVEEATRFIRSLIAMADGDPELLARIAGELEEAGDRITTVFVGDLMDEVPA